MCYMRLASAKNVYQRLVPNGTGRSGDEGLFLSRICISAIFFRAFFSKAKLITP